MTDKESKVFIGVDVSKEWLDIAFSNSADVSRIDNTGPAIAAFIAERVARQPLGAVAFEATGGYERTLMQALASAKLPARRLHPSRIHAFAKIQPRRAKTDPLDARLIAAYVALFADQHDETGFDEPLEELKALLARESQLKAMIQAELCRAKGPGSPTLKPFIEALLAPLKAQLAEIRTLIDTGIASDPVLAHRRKLLLTFKGVGKQTANTILIALGAELGRIDNRKIANLAGLAPIVRQSGKKSPYARTTHGRTHVKSVLYMSAVCAATHNPAMRKIYLRLTGKGKPAKVALVAIMRKTLITLNAIIKTDQPWKGNLVLDTNTV